MPRLFDRSFTRQQLQDLTGDMSQLAYARRSELIEGNERGAGLIDVFNASGLSFSLLPGRALDIASASYKGMSLGFRSNTGDVGPAFYEPDGFGWLRGFFGGLLATCGMTFVGHPEVDKEEENEELGLHGRLSYIPAKQVRARSVWEEDDYVIEVTGTMRESVVFGTDLLMSRQIRTVLGQRSIQIHDRVENLAASPSPLMILYHMNPGFPVLDTGSRFLIRSEKSTAWNDDREVGPEAYEKVGQLHDQPHDDVYVHRPVPDDSGMVEAALVNDALGLGIDFHFSAKEMPLLTQWQHFSRGTFVTGIEAGNCSPLGRAWTRKNGYLENIDPGQVRDFHMQIGVLDGETEIAAAEARIRG
ncbi:MAG: aldose 1-epimerase family protein [Fuerstiella sp.]|nr:aldose 1-epimerase family protein [Fuerstiella sp.]